MLGMYKRQLLKMLYVLIITKRKDLRFQSKGGFNNADKTHQLKLVLSYLKEI